MTMTTGMVESFDPMDSKVTVRVPEGYVVPVGMTVVLATIPGTTMKEVQEYMIRAAYTFADESNSRAAEILGVSVRNMQYQNHRLRLKTPAPTGEHRKEDGSA